MPNATGPSVGHPTILDLSLATTAHSATQSSFPLALCQPDTMQRSSALTTDISTKLSTLKTPTDKVQLSRLATLPLNTKRRNGIFELKPIQCTIQVAQQSLDHIHSKPERVAQIQDLRGLSPIQWLGNILSKVVSDQGKHCTDIQYSSQRESYYLTHYQKNVLNMRLQGDHLIFGRVFEDNYKDSASTKLQLITAFIIEEPRIVVDHLRYHMLSKRETDHILNSCALIQDPPPLSLAQSPASNLDPASFEKPTAQSSKVTDKPTTLANASMIKTDRQLIQKLKIWRDTIQSMNPQIYMLNRHVIGSGKCIDYLKKLGMSPDKVPVNYSRQDNSKLKAQGQKGQADFNSPMYRQLHENLVVTLDALFEIELTLEQISNDIKQLGAVDQQRSEVNVIKTLIKDYTNGATEAFDTSLKNIFFAKEVSLWSVNDSIKSLQGALKAFESIQIPDDEIAFFEAEILEKRCNIALSIASTVQAKATGAQPMILDGTFHLDTSKLTPEQCQAWADYNIKTIDYLSQLAHSSERLMVYAKHGNTTNPAHNDTHLKKFTDIIQREKLFTKLNDQLYIKCLFAQEICRVITIARQKLSSLSEETRALYRVQLTLSRP